MTRRILKRILIICSMLVLVSCELLQQPEKKATKQLNQATELKIDFAKTYAGVIPCFDCDGQSINLSLTKNKAYDRSIDYLGKSSETFFEKGHWSFKNGILTLFTTKNIEKEGYKVEQGNLVLYSQNGQIMVSVEDYLLTPQ